MLIRDLSTYMCMQTQEASREMHQIDPCRWWPPCCSPNISLPLNFLTTWGLGRRTMWPGPALELWAAASQDHLMHAAQSPPPQALWLWQDNQPCSRLLFPWMRLKCREVKLLTQSHTDKKQNWYVSPSHLALESNSDPLHFHHLFPQAFLTSLKNHFIPLPAPCLVTF